MKPTDFAKYLTTYLSSFLPGQRVGQLNTTTNTIDITSFFCRNDTMPHYDAIDSEQSPISPSA